ncbi:hypothetical protein Patl1_07289 [Pistacia atlantica]|uniref:Uncharacterized protein n=1 Tax=Pistacia atlantica TaxID=434234 RepID=A0ACC1ADA4_9ROSI|nr:hypothetical protein Patl1_07289 [Pistacia atlantica]
MSTSLKLPWKLHILFYLNYFIKKLCVRSNGTLNRRLHNLFDLKNPPTKTPKNGVSTSDTVINSSRNLWFRLYTPQGGDNEETSNFPIIIYFHGGGFTFFKADSFAYDNWCKRLAVELQAVIISVNYRLAPEHKFPSQYEDGFEALKFLGENFNKLSIIGDPGLCFIAGDSAGGNLAHHVAVKAAKYEFQKVKLIGYLAIQPFFGGEERTEAEKCNSRAPVLTLESTDWFWKAFLPDGSDRDHPAANVFGPKSSVDMSQVEFPETLVFIGGFDLLKDWQRRYYEGLKKAGKEVHLVEIPGAFHGSYAFKELKESSLFVKEIKIFMKRILTD